MVGLGLVLSLTGIAAQEKPNFSGEWILVSPSEPPAGTPRGLTVALDASSVKITRVSESGSESVVYKINPGTRTDSGVTGTVGGPSIKSEARWVGSSLKFDNGTCRRQPDGVETCEERIETWSAGPKPGLLTIERTQIGSEKRVATATSVYRRPER
jgi:hypothetical protein